MHIPHRADPVGTRQWISFDDPFEPRTWMFDATFLTSNYQCIYGNGCQGVLTEKAPELQQGCCSYGAHFTDHGDYDDTVAYAERLTPEVWQFHDVAVAKGGFAVERKKGGPGRSRLVDGACIFLNRPGFTGGTGCAFHIGALAAGERPLDWKPNVCWQVPVRFDERDDEFGHPITTVSEWGRREWSGGGAEFAWWCTEEPEAFSGHEPVYVSMRDELIELCSEEIYALLVLAIERRDEGVPVAHPTVRKKQ